MWYLLVFLLCGIILSMLVGSFFVLKDVLSIESKKPYVFDDTNTEMTQEQNHNALVYDTLFRIQAICLGIENKEKN